MKKHHEDLYKLLSDILSKRKRIYLTNTQDNIILDQEDKNKYSQADLWQRSPKNYKHSAVLVPIFLKDDKLNLLLTQRTQKVQHHKGEISFPGGAKDEDDPTLEYTAIRETEEEIGIPGSNIKILGLLDDTFTLVSQFIITPYVGIIPYPYKLNPNYNETKKILEIPVDFFLKLNNYWEDTFYYEGMHIKSPFFKWDDNIIWGVTGYIITNLCAILKTIY